MTKYLLNLLVTVALLTMANMAYSGARTNWATPIRIDIERGNGVMIYGAFGNANDCTITDRIYIKKAHPQYDQIYSAVLAALSTKSKVRAYIHVCEPVAWYSVSSVTYNILNSNGDFQIEN